MTEGLSVGTCCLHTIPHRFAEPPLRKGAFGATLSFNSVAKRLLNYSLFIIHFSLKKKNPPMVDQTIGGLFLKQKKRRGENEKVSCFVII